MALRIIIGMSAFPRLLKPQRTSSQLWPYGFMPYAAPVRLVADVLAETARRNIARASVNRLTNAPIIARRGGRQPAVRF